MWFNIGIPTYVKSMEFGERVKVRRVKFTNCKILKSTGDCIRRNSILKQKYQYHFVEKQKLVGPNRTYTTPLILPKG